MTVVVIAVVVVSSDGRVSDDSDDIVVDGVDGDKLRYLAVSHRPSFTYTHNYSQSLTCIGHNMSIFSPH